LLSTAEDSKGRIALYHAEKMDKQSFAKAVNAAITQESWEGLDQEAVASYADYLETYMDIAEESAEEVARAVVKMNKGVENLNQNWAEWGDILKNSKKSSQEYAEAMQNTRNALSDILDVSEEFIRVNFISKAKNMELIGEAAEGSAEAIDALGRALAQDILS
jgi:phage terminase small subunit